MNIVILKNLILNISFLIILGQLLTKSKLVKNIVYEKNIGEQKLLKQLGLALLFGFISIISTYMGVEINGSIVNMRVTSVLASGIIGGPVVGIVTALIAGVHRYFYDFGGLTSTACGISTVFEGILGISASRFLRENKWKRRNLFLIGLSAGAMQMLMIAWIAKPYQQAIMVIRMIGLPMSVFNAFGLVLFVATFNSIFIDQDNAAADGMRLAMEISDKCLAMFRKGIYNNANMQQVVKVLMSKTDFCGAAIYSNNGLVAYQSSYFEFQQKSETICPHLADMVLKHGKCYMMERTKEDDPFYRASKDYSLIGAPLRQKEEVVGCFLVLVRKHKISYKTDIDFIEALAKTFSTQLELAEVDIQRQLRQKAEFQALQTQINPHFLFNALNTITAFCREKPERARELLIILSTYFRKTLNNENYMVDIYQEIDHVMAYLELEKARFEERLELRINIERQIQCRVPCFILQPIVENAVKHGAMKRVKGIVKLSMKQSGRDIVILVQDNGYGISKDIIKQLYQGLLDSNKVGMSNVHKRLTSIYGKAYGLQISGSERGTRVHIRIPVKEQKNDKSVNY